jgi:hypothetical protein
MTATIEEPTTETQPPDERPGTTHPGLLIIWRLVLFLGGGLLLLLVFSWAFDFMRDRDANRLFVVLIAMVIGVLGCSRRSGRRTAS